MNNYKGNFVLQLVLILFSMNLSAQEVRISGLIMSEHNVVLPYANLFNLNGKTGTISNEEGYYQFVADMNDTIRFSYMGHKTLDLPVKVLLNTSEVRLKDYVIALNEATVTMEQLSAKDIVKMVLKNYDANYPQRDIKQEVFIRMRDRITYNTMHIEYKKSTTPLIDRAFVRDLTSDIEKPVMSFTDIYGCIFHQPSNTDSLNFAITPFQAVELREEDMFKMSRVDSIAKALFLGNDSTRYWKFKSGILPVSVEFNERDSTNSDSIKWLRTRLLNLKVQKNLALSRFEDKRKWEFLHKMGRYNYVIEGKTQFEGKTVYIITFEPKNNGIFRGQLYVSKNDFAILRADYAYADNKRGRDFNLLGVSFSEQGYTASIEFEKQSDGYLLKYFSFSSRDEIVVDRPLTMTQKQERVLFDKTLEKVKLNINVDMLSVHQFEVFVYNNQPLKLVGSERIKLESIDIVQVNQFSDTLWTKFPSIEPTQQMRAYRKVAQ